MLRKKPFVFYSRGKIEVKGLGLRETYFIEPANGFDGVKTIMVERADSSLQSSLPVERQMEFIRSSSFVRYNQIVQLKPSASIVSHNATTLGSVSEVKANLLSCQSATTMPQSQVTTEEDSIVIRVPTSDELKRREEEEEQWTKKGVVLTGSAVPLCVSAGAQNGVETEGTFPSEGEEAESHSGVKGKKKRKHNKCIIS